jgi:aerobic C4-dicarboxylate transport protein
MRRIDSPTIDVTNEEQRMRRPTRLGRKLYVQVLVGIALGAAVGFADPVLATSLKPLGDVFIKAIRVVVTPIIFTTIVVGIAKAGDLRQIASLGLRAIVYFEVISTLALLVGMAVGNLWPVGSGINADPQAFDPKAVADFVSTSPPPSLTSFLLNIVPSTFVDPFIRGETLQVLFVAVLFALALCHDRERTKPLVDLIERISVGLFGMVRIIMYFAPIGAFGAMAFTIGKYGLRTALDLGQLVLAVYLVSILFVIVVLGSALRLSGFNIWNVLAYFKDEILFVFAATSAETMIPRSMEKLERLGCTKEVVGLVMPTGFSFNMDGTAIYMSIGILFLAHAMNIHLSMVEQLTALLVMLLTSKGAAGVTGGGFVALAATLPAVNLVPVGGLALLVGVDRFMAEIRAATNLTSNVIATLVVARWSGAVEYDRAREILEGRRDDRKSAPLMDTSRD